LGGRHRRIALRVVAIEGGQCLRKGIDKECVPVLSWKHKQLDTADALHDGLLCCR
jgi:hypothetical protein